MHRQWTLTSYNGHSFRFLPVLRKLSRLELAATAPLMSHFGETLAGIGSIRAFQVNIL